MLDRAETYLEKTLEPGTWKKEKVNGANRVKYEISVSDAAAEAPLNGLQAFSPNLDIEASLISDIEGRDHSFWRTTRYRSAADENGKRCFEVSVDTGRA